MTRERITSMLKWTGIVVVGLAVIYAVFLVGSTIQLRRAYADLAKEGRPMRAEEVIPAQVPDGENAALLYQSAILRLKAEPAGEENLLERLGGLSNRSLDEPLDPNEQGELDRLLQSPCLEQALGILEEGSRRPQCRFDLDYDKGLGIQFGHASGLHNITSILCAKADGEASRGDGARAWQTLETTLRLAEALRSEPFLLSQAVRMSHIRKALATLQRLCQESPPGPQQIAACNNLLKTLDDEGPYIAALDGERLLFGEWVFRLRRSDLRSLSEALREEESWESWSLWLGWPCKPLLQVDHATYLRAMHTHMQTVQGPYTYAGMARVGQAIDGLPWYARATKSIIPSMVIAVRHLESKALVRVTLVGLAALSYRQAHTVFPEDIDALGLQDLVDPFSGQSPVYRPEGEGFIVYSVGPDQKDNSATPRPKDRGDPNYREGWDIVWRYPGPGVQANPVDRQ
ncbi:MAG: hypothetical protein KBE04_00785 [Phycisphaerae bacterium]|nr:hypothetical protein [Phycisphaerae bacterium]